ncbi:MAG: phosphoenolpyruvate--protein phosphotransferase [Actinobacteria bacterium 13_1_20CM_3_68_10]|nr:MAG: phosphoenolpyruvate--protein phosphotransferase [Actinobacteria bacterium 13_1_20CM_3_68_10]
MVGIVIVSHSNTLAEGVRELAAEMAGPEVKLELAGGLAEEGALGTDAVRVMEAIGRADSGDVVLVLMDLGSAVLSAETALDFLTPEQRESVLLCEAPLVEGAVAAAVAARLGEPLAEVAKEARGGLQGKVAQLGAGEPAAPGPAGTSAPLEEGLTLRLDIRNPLGLHARPAARFVQTAAGFDANVQVMNLTSGRGPASGRSLNGLATLGIRQGHEILVSAHGPQAAAALDALAALAKRDFDEQAAPATPPTPVAPPAAPPDAGQALTGLPGAPGIVSGPARHFRPLDPEIPTGSSGDPEAEWEALTRALDQVRTEIRSARESVAARAGDYSAAIFDAHLLFLDDEALLGPARHAIFDDGKNAAEAWHEAAEAVAAEYRALDDEYLQARAEDLTGVARQVVAALTGAAATGTLSAPGIVVAADLTPADTASLDQDLALGIATAAGSPTSHSAILARSLGIPAAVGLGEGLLSVPEGAELLLDGDAGTVHVDPDAELAAEYKRRSAERKQAAQSARAAASEPSVTLDGRRIEVVANIGSPEDVAAAIENGAEGVGLLRTEFLFLERDSMPSEDEQVAAYTSVAKGLEGRPLILRTLDVGADKPLPYLPQRPEANPFLGVRGIRLALEQPELLETQLRAVLRTAAEYPLKVMFPMVATLDEYRQAKAVLADVRAGLERAGAPTPDELDVGVMIEVPAAALAAEQFVPEVGFFSLGTNDLTQYTMAAERGNAAVAGLADGLHPSVLRLIRTVAEAAKEHGKWAGICGELASDPVAVPVLVGLGIAELSANAPAIPAVKQAVRGLDGEAARDLAEQALELSSAAEVRQLVADEAAVPSRSPAS